MRPTLIKIAPQDIDLLNRYLCTKTIIGVQLGYDEEARQVLQASLTDPPIWHAISSHRALQEMVETSGHVPSFVTLQTPSYGYGIRKYVMALGSLASNFSESVTIRENSSARLLRSAAH